MIRKTNVLHDKFRGTNVPNYMKKHAEERPEIAQAFNNGNSPAAAYNFKPVKTEEDGKNSMVRTETVVIGQRK